MFNSSSRGVNLEFKFFFSKIQLLYLLTCLFACAFLSFVCFVSHMTEFDALLASRRSF